MFKGMSEAEVKNTLLIGRKNISRRRKSDDLPDDYVHVETDAEKRANMVPAMYQEILHDARIFANVCELFVNKKYIEDVEQLSKLMHKHAVANQYKLSYRQFDFLFWGVGRCGAMMYLMQQNSKLKTQGWDKTNNGFGDSFLEYLDLFKNGLFNRYIQTINVFIKKLNDPKIKVINLPGGKIRDDIEYGTLNQNIVPKTNNINKQNNLTDLLKDQDEKIKEMKLKEAGNISENIQKLMNSNFLTKGNVIGII